MFVCSTTGLAIQRRMSALPPKADKQRAVSLCPLCARTGQRGWPRYRDEGRVIGRTSRIYEASAVQKFWA
jgi:hypothetical protein